MANKFLQIFLQHDIYIKVYYDDTQIITTYDIISEHYIFNRRPYPFKDGNDISMVEPHFEEVHDQMPSLPWAMGASA